MNISESDLANAPAAELPEIAASLYIDGRFKDSVGRLVSGVNPANAAAGFSYNAATSEEVDQAVQAASSAVTGSWASTPPGVRKRLLLKLASEIELHAETLSKLDSEDVGKPISMAKGEVPVAAGFIRYYAEAIDKMCMGEVPATGSGITEVQHLRPWGVVAAIIPWNFPLINACLKLGPLLAAGNTCVLKPADISPRSALFLAKLASEADLPPGVVNVVAGDAETSGSLIAHPNVDMVTFTGSTATGKKILSRLGQSTIKPLLLECGGKSPELIFDDAADLDLTAIAARIVAGAFWNQGQVCVARSRILIHESCYDSLSRAIVEEAAKIQPGLPHDEQTSFGPMASKAQLQTVLDAVSEGLEEGATLLLDGRAPSGLGEGFFVGPTIFGEVSADSALTRREIFGPVLSLQRFATEDEAVALANGTEYGLAATVWTRDIARGQRLARALKSGKLRLVSSLDMSEPAGFNHSAEPCGQSGFGVEGGLEGMRSYLRRQSVEYLHG